MTLKTKAEQDIEKFYKNITYKQENGYDKVAFETGRVKDDSNNRRKMRGRLRFGKSEHPPRQSIQVAFKVLRRRNENNRRKAQRARHKVP